VTAAEALPVLPAARMAATIGQATAIEQARAVAEVQAAVVVAQQYPATWTAPSTRCATPAAAWPSPTARSTPCPTAATAPPSTSPASSPASGATSNTASRAAPRRRSRRQRGTGVRVGRPDQHPIHRTFVVPHERMKGGKRQKLTDLGDIYLSNQNVGARAVRECIFTVLPTWFTEEARIESHGIRLSQLEDKVGSKRAKWEGVDVSQLEVIARSLRNGEITADEEFPAARVTADDIPKRSKPQAPQSPAAEAEPPAEPISEELPYNPTDEPQGWQS
jgi:hypothetical protein